MKRYTKKFLAKSVTNNKRDDTAKNAKRAQKKLKLPTALWVELWRATVSSNLAESIERSEITTRSMVYNAMMAGVVIGWAEAKRSIK